MAETYPDLALLEDVVHPTIIQAAKTAAAAYANAGVPHALAGALAVGAWGYPRHSKDVDFFVGDEAFEMHGGGLITLAPGVPISIGKIAVDSLSATPEEPFMRDAITRAQVKDGIPILPIEALIYLKLKSPRRKDSVDVVELVKAGIDVALVRGWLGQNAPAMMRRFDGLVREAEEER